MNPAKNTNVSGKPLAIDLFCGLGGWTDGLLLKGYDVVGFDIEQHQYGEQRYPAHLVIQDILSLHGSQFKDATLIVASPPCQEFSYMAMPWSLAKEKRRKIKDDPVEQKRLTALFDACFRIQREACEAAGHHIPMVVENVRGAQEWVGRARWAFGSYYLWGDVPALMPIKKSNSTKVPSISGRRTDPGNGARFTSRDCGIEASERRKGKGAGAKWFDQNLCSFSSKSNSRKAASAMIAKIPLTLSEHIASAYYPLIKATA